MNLLVSCGVFHPRKGGAESLFFDLCGALAARGHDVTVLTRRFPATAASEAIGGFRIVREDWPVPYEDVSIDAEFVRRSPAVLWRTWRLLRSRRITTVCIGLLDMSAIYLLVLERLMGFRLVTYLHGAEVRDLPKQSKRFDRMVRCCFAASDAIVSVAPDLAETARRAYPGVARKVTVIPNGIDVRRHAAVQPERRPRAYVLYLGRLDREKNVDLVIRAYAKASTRVAGVDLLIAGAGAETDALTQLADDLGVLGRGVELVGAVERERARALTKGALGLVLASDIESHPIAAIEALAAGKAVIAPRVSGITDVIEDGVNGVLFERGDSDALAELLVRLTNDAAWRQSLERHIAAVDLRCYDIEALLDRHLAVLAPPP